MIPIKDSPARAFDASTFYDFDRHDYDPHVAVSAWQHIYDRHWIPTFAGDIRSMNTFWKQDPLTNMNVVMLQPEIELLLDRRLDMFKLYRDEESASDIRTNDGEQAVLSGTIDAMPTSANKVYRRAWS